MSLFTHNFSLRLVALLLVSILSFGCLTACDDSTPDNTETDSATETEVESPTETETETETQPDPLPDVPAATQFTVSNVFSDNMVVQRNEHVRVWGWADDSQNGKRVSGTFLNTTAHTIIENGEWILTFKQTWNANTAMGNHMTIYGDGVAYTFADVLVGDVYMAIGQSNIHYQVSTHLANTSPDKHGVRNPNALIRLHFNSQTQVAGNYPKWGSDDVCKEIVSSSRWQLPLAPNTDRFSALAYYFALNLLEANNHTVPIGLIEVEASGKALSAFLSNEVATATGSDVYNASLGIYQAIGLLPNEPTRFVYNQYIYPFEKYAIGGIIWYQGESDLHPDNTVTYADKFIPLMNQMRETHNVLNKDFPIYLMELAYCSDIAWNFGGVRAVQGEIAARLSNTYLIPSCDFEAPFRDLLHPDIKWEQAQRLAAVAAAVEYGQGTLDEALGPVLVSIEFSDKYRTAVLTYDHVGSGLKTIDGSDAVNGFILCGTNYEAMMQTTVTATITAPNQITITGTRPFRGIAYNHIVTNLFGAGEALNLCNSYGLPAGACFAYPAPK